MSFWRESSNGMNSLLKSSFPSFLHSNSFRWWAQKAESLTLILMPSQAHTNIYGPLDSVTIYTLPKRGVALPKHGGCLKGGTDLHKICTKTAHFKNLLL